MIVDDELFDQKCAQRILTKSGLVGNVVCFGYPDEALAYLLRADRPVIDVILLDINMPRMSGFEFLERAQAELGAHVASVVVIMLTTSLALTDVARAQDFPIVRDYLRKPLRPEDIPRIVAHLQTRAPCNSTD